MTPASDVSNLPLPFSSMLVSVGKCKDTGESLRVSDYLLSCHPEKVSSASEAPALGMEEQPLAALERYCNLDSPTFKNLMQICF
jgi:hypothetical protein